MIYDTIQELCIHIFIYVTGPEKTDHIYIKYTCSYYGAYLFSVYAIQIL